MKIKKLKKNLIFILMGILLFSMLTPFSVMATEANKIDVIFETGNSGVSISSRTIRLWKYDEMLEAHNTNDANQLLEKLKESYNKGTLEKDLGQPLDVSFTNLGNFVLKTSLEPGFYVGIEDVVASSGRVLKAFHAFWLKKDKLSILPKFVLENEPGRVILKKIDDKGNLLSDVGFRLYFAVDHPLNSTGDLLAVSLSRRGNAYVYDLMGKPIDLFTDENGRIEVSNLPPGSYVFREVSPRKGYTIEKRDTYFSVSANMTTEETVINRPGGAFNFRKIDAKTKAALAGARFVVMEKLGDSFVNVRDASGQNIVLVSDVNGLFSVSGLPYGVYYLWEVAAPSGYRLLSEPVSFEIGKGTEGLLINIENVPGNPPPDNPPDNPPINPPDEPTPPSPGGPEIPKTGDITILIMCLVGAIMVGMGRYFIREDSMDNF